MPMWQYLVQYPLFLGTGTAHPDMKFRTRLQEFQIPHTPSYTAKKEIMEWINGHTEKSSASEFLLFTYVYTKLATTLMNFHHVVHVDIGQAQFASDLFRR